MIEINNIKICNIPLSSIQDFSVLLQDELGLLGVRINIESRDSRFISFHLTSKERNFRHLNSTDPRVKKLQRNFLKSVKLNLQQILGVEALFFNKLPSLGVTFDCADNSLINFLNKSKLNPPSSVEPRG